MARNTVKEERESLALTQRQLSEAADVTMSSLQKIEQHAFSPNVDHALGIAEALGVTVEEIFSRDRSRIRLRKAVPTLLKSAEIPA